MFERRREVFFSTLINSYNIIVIRLNHYLRVINRFSRPLNSLSRAEHFRHSLYIDLQTWLNAIDKERVFPKLR